MNTVLAGLGERGLVRRPKQAEGGWRLPAELTAEGCALVEQADQRVRRIEERMLAHWVRRRRRWSSPTSHASSRRSRSGTTQGTDPRRLSPASAVPSAEARCGQRRGDRGRVLLEQGERLDDAALELRILPAHPGVGREGHLDVRVHAVVLDRPLLALEPAGVLRLGDAGAVDEVVAAVDPDHAAPGAGAD